MAIHSETAALTPTITVDSAAIKRAERVRLYLLRPEDFKKANSAVRRTSFDRATASIPPVRDHLMIREMGDALRGPEVLETETEVVIAFAVVPVVGDANCPGNPSTPVTVSLDAPLGDRTLRDVNELGD